MATIGIDVSALSTSASGGIGTSQYQTMRALAELDEGHRFVLYAPKRPLVPFTDRPLDLPWPVRLGSGLFTHSNVLWMQTGVNRLLSDDGVEVFWGPRHLLPFRAKGIGTVATVHDFVHRYYPREQAWLNRQADRLLITRIAARADVLVAPSGSTACDAARFLGIDTGSVRVVPWGVDRTVFRPQRPEVVAELLARLNVPSPYLLCFEVYNLRKNFSTVLAAVSQLSGESRRPLSIVGLGRPRKSASSVDVEGRARELGLADRLHLPGDVTREDLATLYSGAMALVYPSLYEGFGLPALEAMACGCPVIAARSSSLPEVVGEAALLIDPASASDLAAAIARLARDAGERARLVSAGSARAQTFTWRSTAQLMLACFAEALPATAPQRVGGTT